MYDALRAEYMAVSMYMQEDGLFRKLLANETSAHSIAGLLALIFADESRLYSNMYRGIIEFSRGKLIKPVRIRINRDNYPAVIEYLVTRTISNTQPVLRAVFADMLLRTLEVAWKMDLGWKDAKGILFLRRVPVPAYRVIGVQIPVTSGRSKQPAEDPQIILEGLRQIEGRTAWAYYQGAGDQLEVAGKKFIPYDPQPGFKPPLRE